MLIGYSYSALTNEMTCYNIVSSGVGNQLPSGCDVLSGRLAVPSRPGHTAARSLCALNLLGMSTTVCNTLCTTLCTTVYHCVPLCVTVCHCVSLCTTLSHWQCQVDLGTRQRAPSVHSTCWVCVSLCVTLCVPLCVPLCTTVYHCVSLCVTMYHCVPLCMTEGVGVEKRF